MKTKSPAKNDGLREEMLKGHRTHAPGLGPMRLLALMVAIGLGAAGLAGCAGHPGFNQPPAQHPPMAEMGPAEIGLQLAQAAPGEPDDPFADPTEEEEAQFLEELGEEVPPARVADPLERWNRLMFRVNDRLYFGFLKPVAQGYRWVLPAFARRGIRNFFSNLGTPVRLVNNLLQGRAKAAGAELGRFVVNTTEGVLGFGDPASRYPELVIPREDLGQTFASYGIGQGIYLVWPLVGPATLRDTVGLVGDAFMDPLSYLVALEVWLGVRGVDAINETSFRIGDYEALKEAALDPYGALRNGYIQRRNRQIEE